MIASHGLAHNGITLEYKDHVGYRDVIDSTDSFIRNKIGKQLLQAMITIGKQVIKNFDSVEGLLDPPLPSWRPVVIKWYKDTTGRDFPENE